MVSAIRQDTLGDYAARLITIAGIALPNFWVAIMLIFLLVMWFNWLPPLGYANLWEKPAINLQQLIFPAIATKHTQHLSLIHISEPTRPY